MRGKNGWKSVLGGRSSHHPTHESINSRRNSEKSKKRGLLVNPAMLLISESRLRSTSCGSPFWPECLRNRFLNIFLCKAVSYSKFGSDRKQKSAMQFLHVANRLSRVEICISCGCDRSTRRCACKDSSPKNFLFRRKTS